MIVQSELLVRIVDRALVQGKQNQRRRNAGDVVVVMPAGHAWSQTELDAPQWIIIKTDMPFDEACEFTAEAPYTREQWHDKPPVKQDINLNALFQGSPNKADSPYEVVAQDLRDNTRQKVIPQGLARGHKL